jgi:hypothetical protein
MTTIISITTNIVTIAPVNAKPNAGATTIMTNNIIAKQITNPNIVSAYRLGIYKSKLLLEKTTGWDDYL